MRKIYYKMDTKNISIEKIVTVLGAAVSIKFMALCNGICLHFSSHEHLFCARYNPVLPYLYEVYFYIAPLYSNVIKKKKKKRYFAGEITHRIKIFRQTTLRPCP